MIYIFDILTGKILKTINSKPKFSEEFLIKQGIDKLEYERRKVVEKEIEKS